MTATAKPRYEWPDVARGVCMVLVVLWHSSGWVRDEVYGGPPAPWLDFGLWMTPLRMPLFFYISGYFSISVLSRPLRLSRRRTWGIFYLYVIWTFIFLCRLYLPQARDQGPAPTPGQMLTALLLPTSFWYLWCLPVFFLLSYLLHRWMGERAKWLLIPLAIIALLAPLVRPYTMGILVQPMDAVKAPSFLGNFVWFFAGTCTRAVWDHLMKTAKWWKFAAGCAVYAGTWVVASVWIHTDEFAWQLVPLAAVALFTSAQALALVPMQAAPVRMLRRIGQDTLPIYLFHIFLISIISAGSKVTGLIGVLRHDLPNLSWIIPPVMVAILIPSALLLAKLIRRSPLRFMLVAPAWLTSSEWPRGWARWAERRRA